MNESSKRVLLDTNVLIALEDTNKKLSSLLAKIKRLCSENHVLLYIHPAQKKYDIENDRDKNRKRLLQQRAEQYSTLDIEYPPISILDKSNDQVDQLLLKAVNCGAVHYLISEDVGLHKKAKQQKISEPVFYIRQFEKWLEKEFCSSVDYPPPYDLQKKFLYEIDIKSTFFDSLRNSYPGFNAWYQKVSKNHRKAWIVYADYEHKHIGAICIYKLEVEGEVKKLKLCTFKVEEEMQGQKIGERLLYHSFQYAENTKVSEIYIEVKSSQKHLINLCEEYGFRHSGQKDNQIDENIYTKQMTPPNKETFKLNSFDYCVRFFPHYRDNVEIQKHLIPIQPKYHQQLFPDTNVGFIPGLEPLVRSEGRAIKKAYICHSNNRSLKQGDIIFFYQSQKETIAVCAIVEHACAIPSGNIEELHRLVTKRTVYSPDELYDLIKKDCLVILFRLIQTIKNPIYRPIEISVPQSISRLDERSYIKYFKDKFNCE